MSSIKPVLSRRDFVVGGAGAAAQTSAMFWGMSPAFAQKLGRPAPQWQILEWINGDGGNIDTLRGKVIIIDFFQLWCPGCNQFSGPLMTYWQEKFAAEVDAGKMAFVKIHTVFEGHNYQTVRRLKRYVKEKGITIPVGVDKHLGKSRVPETMRLYGTRGTPEMVIVDAEGFIRFQQFGFFEPHKTEPLITSLIKRARA